MLRTRKNQVRQKRLHSFVRLSGEGFALRRDFRYKEVEIKLKGDQLWVLQ